MRVPGLRWDRRHNVATLTVSFCRGRIWDTRDIGELILGYNAAGRLARVVFLDPRRAFPPDATEQDACDAALRLLGNAAPARDLDVIRSARRRAPVKLARGA